MDFTLEQLAAIDRRDGDLLLDASAGSGKTSVLVERFVRAVLEDGVEVTAILTITFTEKAAAELRDRIRQRFRELGALDAARATEGAFISTIHGFCARLLRANALAAGIDPEFLVLDRADAGRLADAALDDALEDLAQNVPGAIDLIASYGPGGLRWGILSTYSELRSRGDSAPGLPSLPPGPDIDVARTELSEAAERAAQELGAHERPSARVVQALDRLERCSEVMAQASREQDSSELGRLRLPGGNGAALTTPACAAYRDALERFREACEYPRGQRTRDLLDQLLRGFGSRYARRKRERSSLDFEDLELMARDLLARSDELRARYRARFEHIMVDELQDTNQVQLELIESIARGNLFTVGDAQQSIYGFRHADVELFRRRGERLEGAGARATLQTNFRSRKEIIGAINHAFSSVLGARFRELIAGRTDPPASEPLVELMIVDKGADWTPDETGLASAWRLAEARALASRIRALVDGGVAPREFVVLTRATTDLRAYERALEQCGIPTYMIGGRGYWSHPQVIDLVSYLRALANPRDEEALYTVLASPLVGISFDALVVLAAAGRESGRNPWWLIQDREGRLDELVSMDQDRLDRFGSWFASEREDAPRLGIEELLQRALEHTGYDLRILGMPGGARRLANIRKLMRLGREHEEKAGRDLRGFLDLVRGRPGAPGPPDARESEAPVEAEALDAVRLMTIHRAKGLEFPIVCVADLGRGPQWRTDLVRVGADGRLGLRLAQPGTGQREPALHYKALGDEQRESDDEEERRLFYVAATRAKERLILSGAAKFEAWAANGSGGGPISWLGPALIGPLLAEGLVSPADGVDVEVTLVTPEDLAAPVPAALAAGAPEPPPPPAVRGQPAAQTGSPVTTLSYSALGEYERCGYRFYLERVLGLPPRSEAPVPGGSGLLSGAERGVLVHALLERLDFRRPVLPDEDEIMAVAERSPNPQEVQELATLIERFAGSELCARLGALTEIRREERFAFLLGGGLLITGALDVLAREPGGRMLVVDYKSDRLQGADPAALVAGHYETQRLIYALAAIKAGAEEVEVVHVFLERPGEPVSAVFGRGDVEPLQDSLGGLVAGVVARRFAVTDSPHRSVCSGCPAEGGLCSWPLDLTRREAPDRLF